MKNLPSKILIAGLACLVLTLVLWVFAPRPLQGLQFVVDGVNLAQSDMPWLVNMEGGQQFTATVRLGAMDGAPAILHVFPDDCLDRVYVDGQELSLSHIRNLCEYTYGFDLEIPVTGQEQKLTFIGHNGGGMGGFRADLMNHVDSRRWAMPAMILGTLLLLAGVLLRRGWNIWLVVAVAIGVILRYLHWSYTGWTEHAHDVVGHLDFVRLLSRTWIPPAADACWQCYQPPMYYYPAAIFQNIFQALNAGVPSYWEVQLLSFIANLGFLVAGASLLRRMSAPLWSLVSFVALFSCWPSFVLHSPRIGNDSFMYLFSGLAIRSLWIWWQDRNVKTHAYLASIFAGLALATKTSGVATMAMVALPILFQVRTDFRLVWKNAIIWAGAFLLALAGPLLRYATGASKFLLVNNAGGLDDSVRVAAGPGNFFWFDLKTWVTQPFTSPWDNALGREWFLNYAGKTGLFGEFHLARNPYGDWFAGLVSITALIVVALAIRAVIRMDRKDWPWVSGVLLFVLALAAMRLFYPFSCSNDARYILPVLLPLLVLAQQGIQLPFRSAVIRWICWTAIWILPMASAALFISMKP